VKVNTTAAKHALLAASAGVMQFEESIIHTLVANLQAAARNTIRKLLSDLNLAAYAADETVGNVMQRIIVGDIFELPDNVATSTTIGALPTASKAKMYGVLDKWKIPHKDTDTLDATIKGCRDIFWNPDDQYVEEF